MSLTAPGRELEKQLGRALTVLRIKNTQILFSSHSIKNVQEHSKIISTSNISTALLILKIERHIFSM